MDLKLSPFATVQGMDPAGPFYDDRDETVRLNPSDAKFVDVVHSNAKPLYSGGAGMYAPIGHVDFYPNGGKTQPGCPSVFKNVIGDVLGLNFKGKWIDLSSKSYLCSLLDSAYESPFFGNSYNRLKCVLCHTPKLGMQKIDHIKAVKSVCESIKL